MVGHSFVDAVIRSLPPLLGQHECPHVTDPPLREIASTMLKIKAQAYVVEAAKPPP
jgi:hypothetical protein